MAQKTLLITGASGYLGQHLTREAAKNFDVVATYATHSDGITAGRPVQLDLTNQGAVLETISRVTPEAIIHAAAVNPGRGDGQAMQRVNGDGSRYVAEAAQAAGARLVYVSTDVVHSGQDAPYDDDAVPTPINDYGRSKAAGEAAVVEVDPTAAIVRTSLIYGLTTMDRGTKSFVKRLEAGETLVLFNDVIRQPVWVESLSEALLKLVDIEYAGYLNVVGRQALTREAFGRRMLTWWQIDTSHSIESGRAADISATIPLDLRLSYSKAEKLLQVDLYGVDEVLAMTGSPLS